MTRYRKAFLIWLAVMVPLVAALTIIGTYCEDCYVPYDTGSTDRP